MNPPFSQEFWEERYSSCREGVSDLQTFAYRSANAYDRGGRSIRWEMLPAILIGTFQTHIVRETSFSDTLVGTWQTRLVQRYPHCCLAADRGDMSCRTRVLYALRLGEGRPDRSWPTKIHLRGNFRLSLRLIVPAPNRNRIAFREPIRRGVLGELCQPRFRKHDTIRIFALYPPQTKWVTGTLHVLLLN